MQVIHETSTKNRNPAERGHPLGRLTGQKPALKMKEV